MQWAVAGAAGAAAARWVCRAAHAEAAMSRLARRWLSAGRLAPQPRGGGASALAGFARVDPRAAEAWRRLSLARNAVEAALLRGARPPPEIDWAGWRARIAHTELVDALRSSMEAVAAAPPAPDDLPPPPDASLAPLESEWADATRECEEAVRTSEELVSDGVRALWLSRHAPPAWTVDTNDWLESDVWWQRYVQRHFHLDASKDVEDVSSADLPETDAEAAARAADQLRKLELFHARSDNPTLYQYMDQLHSSDYYDLHRRTFTEHMVYFLSRTGLSHHFFPEVPEPQWVVDLELLRYRWLRAAHARRAKLQLAALSLEEPLDLLPPDSDLDHHGEERFLALLAAETRLWNLIAARHMATYSFLTFPVVPVASLDDLARLKERHDVIRGIFYTLGQDVPAAFFVPEREHVPSASAAATQLPPEPGACLDSWLEHLAAGGTEMNPGYADFLVLHGGTLGKRGPNWFSAPGEPAIQAFTRRLSPEDPTTPVFQQYATDLFERWRKAQKVQYTDVLEKLPAFDEANRTLDKLFGIYAKAGDGGIQKQAQGSSAPSPLQEALFAEIEAAEKDAQRTP